MVSQTAYAARRELLHCVKLRQSQLLLPGCDIEETSRVLDRMDAMLPSLVAPPFHRPGWVYEEKYDAYRILAQGREARAAPERCGTVTAMRYRPPV
jgi:hypothetical protein